jgi:hypothetical protein
MEPQEIEVDPNSLRENPGALATVCADLLFTLLPIIVTVLVTTHYKGFTWMYRSPEFSFASAVIYGQIVVKLLIITMHSPGGVYGGRIILLVAITLVTCLCPTLFILLLLLSAEMTETSPGLLLLVAQAFYFVLAIAVYMFYGTVAEISLGHQRRKHRIFTQE